MDHPSDLSVNSSHGLSKLNLLSKNQEKTLNFQMLLSLPPLPSIVVIHNGIQCRKLTVSDPVKYSQCIHSAKPITVNYFVSFVDMCF